MASQRWNLFFAIHDYRLKFLQRIALRRGWEESRIRDSLLRSLGHFGIADAVDSHLVEVPSRE